MKKTRHRRIYDRTVLVLGDSAHRDLLARAGYRLPAERTDYMEVLTDGTVRPSDRETYYPYVTLGDLHRALGAGGTVAPTMVRGWNVHLWSGDACSIGCTKFRLSDILGVLAASDAQVRRARAVRTARALVVPNAPALTLNTNGSIRIGNLGSYHTVPRQEVVRVARILRAK